MKKDEELINAISIVKEEAYRQIVHKLFGHKTNDPGLKFVDWVCEELGSERVLNKMVEIAVDGK